MRGISGSALPPGVSFLVLAGPAQGSLIPAPVGQHDFGRETTPAGSLGGDPQLSRRHARVVNDGVGHIFIQDLGSTNGTLLNGHPVHERQRIRPGDVIQIGSSRLQVLDDAPGPEGQPGSGASPTEVIRPSAAGFEARDEPLSSSWGSWETGAGPLASAPMSMAPAPHEQSSRPPARRAEPVTPAPPVHAEPDQDEVHRSGKASVQGQIRGIQQRSESMGEGSVSVWTFRLERYDDSGNRMRPIPVQMRAASFDGSLHEGDEARAIGIWKAGTLHTDQVDNLTTQSTVRARSFRKAIIITLIIFAAVAGLLFAGVAALAVHDQRSMFSEYQQQVEQMKNG